MLPDCFHIYQSPVETETLPSQFTYPFQYTPHPLCVKASEELQQYLLQKEEWTDELQKGKMFGVLLVRADTGEIGYLTAFSGILAGQNRHSGFVPPVYDLLQPEGFFLKEESVISEINKQIKSFTSSSQYIQAKTTLSAIRKDAERTLLAARSAMNEAKKRRDDLRKSGITPVENERLILESQHQKAEIKRLKNFLDGQIIEAQEALQTIDAQLVELKNERKTRSAALQLKLFEQFVLLNANGETISLPRLFENTPQQIPPAGTAECAAPRLLQYAYKTGLQPLAMAEFWWGNSPKTEIRHHGYYYPACKHKCEPVLRFMLQGLDVEPNPLLIDLHKNTGLTIVYEDQWIVVVNKPEGMLSVPGKLDHDSILQRLQQRYPQATGPLLVHRLDMATSGLLLAAKTKEVHQQLQAQFSNRTIKKRYEAILDGVLLSEQGKISLPMRPDPDNRPLQVVDYEHGKPAVTTYKRISVEDGKTRVSFFPETGRTHQLRVHAAHPEGLNAPICGDELYGKKADRLYLHAVSLSFMHPVTAQRMTLTVDSVF